MMSRNPWLSFGFSRSQRLADDMGVTRSSSSPTRTCSNSKASRGPLAMTGNSVSGSASARSSIHASAGSNGQGIEAQRWNQRLRCPPSRSGIIAEGVPEIAPCLLRGHPDVRHQARPPQQRLYLRSHPHQHGSLRPRGQRRRSPASASSLTDRVAVELAEQHVDVPARRDERVGDPTRVARRATVKLTEPEFAGSHVVTEKRADGSLVLEPETVDDVVSEMADRPLSEEQQDEMFRRPDAAADRQSTR
jgi:hypothetical protein